MQHEAGVPQATAIRSFESLMPNQVTSSRHATLPASEAVVAATTSAREALAERGFPGSTHKIHEGPSQTHSARRRGQNTQQRRAAPDAGTAVSSRQEIDEGTKCRISVYLCIQLGF